MKKLILFLFFLPFLAFAAPTPSLLGATSTVGTVANPAPTPWSFPHTVPSGGTNNALIALTCKTHASTISGITWQGTSMAELATNFTGSQCKPQAWYLGLPAVATNGTIELTLSGTGGNIFVVAFTLQNVLQSTTTVMEGFGIKVDEVGGTQTQYSTTTVTADSLVLAWPALGTVASNIVDNAAQTNINRGRIGSAGILFDASYMAATTTIANGVNMGVSWTTSALSDLSVISIKSDNTGGGVTPPPPQIPLMFMIFGWFKDLIPKAHAALLSPVEKVLIQKVGKTKLTYNQSRQVIAILNKYLAKTKINYNGVVTLKGLINYLLSR